VWLVRWYAEYNPTTDTQKRYSKSFEKRKQADRFAQQLKDDYELGITYEEKRITLGEFCEKFLEAKRNTYKLGTYRNYKDTITRLNSYFNPSTPLHTINAEYAERFIADVDYIQESLKTKNRQFSDTARNIQLRNCKKMFTTAVKWHYLRSNPFEEIKQVKAQTQPWYYISPDEFQSILNSCNDPYKKAYYAVQYGCGLRAGEAMNLLWDGSNIDFDTNRITIFNRTATSDIPPYSIKDYEKRSVLMPDWVVSLLLELHQQASELTPYVFLNSRKWNTIYTQWKQMQKEGRAYEWDKKILLNNTLRDFKRCCRRAGIKTNEKLCQHCLRKSWANNLANGGVPIKTLMKMGGWSSIECCQEYYLKSTDENENKAVSVLNNIFADKDIGQEEKIKSL
jgi:integrase